MAQKGPELMQVHITAFHHIFFFFHYDANRSLNVRIEALSRRARCDSVCTTARHAMGTAALYSKTECFRRKAFSTVHCDRLSRWDETSKTRLALVAQISSYPEEHL